MKTIRTWVLVAALICGVTTVGLTSCKTVVEMVGTIHHGENLGKKDAILYMFYLSQKDLPLAVQHPEIPLE